MRKLIFEVCVEDKGGAAFGPPRQHRRYTDAGRVSVSDFSRPSAALEYAMRVARTRIKLGAAPWIQEKGKPATTLRREVERHGFYQGLLR